MPMRGGHVQNAGSKVIGNSRATEFNPGFYEGGIIYILSISISISIISHDSST